MTSCTVKIDHLIADVACISVCFLILMSATWCSKFVDIAALKILYWINIRQGQWVYSCRTLSGLLDICIWEWDGHFNSSYSSLKVIFKLSTFEFCSRKSNAGQNLADLRHVGQVPHGESGWRLRNLCQGLQTWALGRGELRLWQKEVA